MTTLSPEQEKAKRELIGRRIIAAYDEGNFSEIEGCYDYKTRTPIVEGTKEISEKAKLKDIKFNPMTPRNLKGNGELVKCND